MIDKYKVLNNEEIQFDKYDAVKTDNEKMKKLMKSKLKSRKQANKKLMVASISATLILGSVVLTNERTWAYVDRLVNHIEYFLDKDYGLFDKYKFEGNQSLEQDGLILNLGDVMLDDRQLIVSLGIDYSNFDLEEHGFNKKEFMPDIPLITIGDMFFPGQGGSIKPRNVRGEDKKQILYTIDLTSIDTDEDGICDTDIELLDKLDENKDYNLKIEFNNFDIGESKTEPGVWLSKEFGKWEFNTKLNISNLSNDMEIIDINKVIDVNEENIKNKLTIEDVRISPVSGKVTMNIEGDASPGTYSLLVTDENGRNLINYNGANGDTEDTVHSNFELKGTERKILITPVIYIDGNGKHLKDEVIEIEIP